jgi:plastocyanin/mono/diheme cytochrome c family protein
MGNAQRATVAFVAVGAVGLCAGYVLIRANGLAADRAPGRVETAVARRLVALSIPASARAMTNPRAGSADAWRDGADHFADHCAVCHGRDGRGSDLARTMYPPVPDLTSPAIQQMSDGALFSIVEHGVRWTGMPAFGSTHSADDIWALVSFIRRTPALTPQDLERGDAHGDAHGGGHHKEGDGATDAATIAMDGTTFTPATLTVKAGATVTWINKDPFPHNVSSPRGGFRSGDLDADTRWQFHAASPGTFPYVCTLHPGMKGTLVVTP